MIVNTDAGTRPLQGGPLEFSEMVQGGRNMNTYSGFGVDPTRMSSLRYATPVGKKRRLRAPRLNRNMAGFGAYGFADDTTDDGSDTGDATDTGPSVLQSIDSLLASGAKLGQAYAQYSTRNKPAAGVPAVAHPVAAASTGIPTWVWIVGGVAIVGGAVFFLMPKKKR